MPFGLPHWTPAEESFRDAGLGVCDGIRCIYWDGQGCCCARVVLFRDGQENVRDWTWLAKWVESPEDMPRSPDRTMTVAGR